MTLAEVKTATQQDEWANNAFGVFAQYVQTLVREIEALRQRVAELERRQTTKEKRK